jgi:zinc protease
MIAAILVAGLAAAGVPAATDPAAAHSAAIAAPPPKAWTTAPPPLARVPSRVATPAPVEVRLANGVRVVVLERHRRPLVQVRLLLPRGAVTDPPRDPGITWLAVHLASDFRERNDHGERLAGEKSLRREVGELGGAFGVAVEPDFSALAVSGYAKDAAKYVALLGDVVTDPRHGASSFEARRGALLDVIEDLESSDPEALERVIVQAAFGTGHPYARSIIGTRKSLEPLGLEDVVAHQEKILAPAGATLLVVGDVTASEVVAAARKAFAGWTREALPPVNVAPTPAPRGPFAVGFLRRSPASTLVACVTRPLADVRASDAALDVFAAAFGAGTRSRLALALREEGGHTYVAHAQVARRRAARALVACAPLDAARADEGLRVFRSALERFRAAGPSEAELTRARALRLAALDEDEEDTSREADAWTEAIAIGPGAPRPEAERRDVGAVTAAEVRRIAAVALRPDGLRWILSGDPAVAAEAVRASGLGRLVALPLDR